MKRTLNTLFLTILLGILLAACARKPEENANHVFPMASMEGMPADVFDAPLTVQQSYQFAAANPDVLQHLPCYCGCGAVGHTSNYDCYVSSKNTDISEASTSSLQYDLHATGCSICVDITQDTMRLLDDGKTLPEIRNYIDATYAQYGPSNMP